MVMKPMSDLCWTCQKNSMAIQRAANTPESDKTDVKANTSLHETWLTIQNASQVLKAAQEHVRQATDERAHYRDAIDSAKKALQATFTIDGQLCVPPVHACLPTSSHDITMHFSFDMAQQVWETSIVHLKEIDMTCITGALSQRPNAARPCLLSYPTQMCHLWGMLWGDTQTGGIYLETPIKY